MVTKDFHFKEEPTGLKKKKKRAKLRSAPSRPPPL